MMTQLLTSRVTRAVASVAVLAIGVQYAAARQAQTNHGWVSIFDGKTLDGWKSAARPAIADGALVLRGGRTGETVCTEKSYGDFVLRFRGQSSLERSRARVTFRAQPGTKGANAGGQTTMFLGGAGLLPQGRGTVPEPLDRVALAQGRDTSRWIDHAVSANGGQIRLFVNGRLMADRIERSDALPRTGVICLHAGDSETDVVRFRDIEVREVATRPEGPLAAASPTVQFRKHVATRAFVSEGVAAADVDRDGDVDLIAGAYWFEAPRWLPHELRPVKRFSVHRGYSDSFLDFALDVNRDGWVDIVQFDFPGRAGYWYENPRGQGGNWTRRVVHERVASESPAMADVNGDGRDDLLFVDAAARQVVWMEAPAKAGDTAWTRHVISEMLPPERSRAMPHGLGFSDVDGDGRRDVISIDAWYRAPAQPDGAWEERLADLGAPAAQMYAFDVDGDGDRDVVSSSAHDYGLWWYEQGRDSAGSARWTRHTIDDRVAVMHALAATDLDGDGVTDLVSGKRFLAHNGNDPGEYDPSVLLWYRGGRDSAGRATFTPFLIDGDAGIGLQIVIRDVTGDGRPDIVTSSKKGIFIFERVR